MGNLENNEAFWVAEHHSGYTPGGNPIYHCSNCHWIFGSHRIFPNYKYCPMCGKKMKQSIEKRLGSD